MTTMDDPISIPTLDSVLSQLPIDPSLLDDSTPCVPSASGSISRESSPLSPTPGPSSASGTRSTPSTSIAANAIQKTSKRKRNSTEERENDDEVIAKKKKGRKPLLAKRVEWSDIPDWTGRKDCPLLELPREILDLCFGLAVDVGLSMRDYISLAGVCRLFRHRMTDKVFKELYCAAEGNGRVTKPSTTHSHRIFTSTSPPDWQYPKKERFAYPLKADYYKPRGLRMNWTEAQYMVYKEEQYFWRVKYRLDKAAQEKRDRDFKRRVYGRVKDEDGEQNSVQLGGMNRRIIGRVRGRENGEPPVWKDDNGKPDEEYYLEINKKDHDSLTTKEQKSLYTMPTEVPESFSKRLRKKIKDVRRKTRGGVWKTPVESDDDHQEDYDVPQFTSEDTSKFMWASEYRKKAVRAAHSRHIGKSPNSMNKKSPQQIFWYSAVEALAYRSHGGPIGHRLHVQRWHAMNEKNISTRRKNKEKALEAGTFTQRKRKHRLLPSEWHRAIKEESVASTATGSSGKGKGRADEEEDADEDNDDNDNEKESVDADGNEDADKDYYADGPAGESGGDNEDFDMDGNDEDKDAKADDGKGEGAEEDDDEDGKDKKENGQWCKAGCKCWKDPFPRCSS
ncbi:hypothetical protein L486_02440 [Kwoniella mangroviensis CBS 10435]|uniref:F-box domain-containing protein n=1 Tax=Kwoniella mangroviensis CBS 10435 TaxID=1331196 RepID=A0A1B9IW66_9TREE|nr:hypothetical protein L486_02440 [Kwoniella mangroviensis CBS 10435]